MLYTEMRRDRRRPICREWSFHIMNVLNHPLTRCLALAAILALAGAGTIAAEPPTAAQPVRERLIIFPIETPKNADPLVRAMAADSLKAGLAKSPLLEVVVFDPASALVTDAVKRGRLSAAQIAGPFTGKTAPGIARALGGVYATIGNIYSFSYMEDRETWGMSFWVKILGADNGEILNESVYGGAKKAVRDGDLKAEADIAQQMAATCGAACARVLLDPKHELGVTASKNLKNGKDW
jgi:hypothetical protein